MCVCWVCVFVFVFVCDFAVGLKENQRETLAAIGAAFQKNRDNRLHVLTKCYPHANKPGLP